MSWFNTFFKKKKHRIIEFTDSPEFVISILKKLQARHSVCTVHFSGDKKQYVTMIIDVDKNKRTFLLDEMVPSEGHKKATNGDPFRITASDNGIAIIFKGQVINTITRDENDYYLLNLPQYIEYKQRRKAFRVPISIENNVPIHVSIKDQEINNIQMRDISFTGVSFIAKGLNLENQIQINNILEPISITTKERKIIYSKLEIKRVRYIERDNNTFVAGRFIDLTHSQQRSIELFISELERENIRNKQDEE